MSPTEDAIPLRFIGLDIHKSYFVATGVNGEMESVFGPQRVSNTRLESWAETNLSRQDAVVLEMTTNTWKVVDTLEPIVHSVTVAHPPHVHLITRAQVMTDRKAALILAQLHAAGLLPPVWVPPQAVRHLRALVAQRWKMVRLGTQAKCRLQSVLHKYHLEPPPKSDPYTPQMRDWWEALPLEPMEHFRMQSDLDTVAFAQTQKKRLEDCLGQYAAQDERVPLLVQIPGIGFINAVTILAAIGEIGRFPSAEQLVGYAGLGTKVHDSGQMQWRGRITKMGRRDLRRAMVEAAQSAAQFHEHWKVEYQRLSKRIGKKKAKVAVARKLLVTVWHTLTKNAADRQANPRQVACSIFALAYKMGIQRLPGGMNAHAFTRQQLDRLGIGQDVTHIPWGKKRKLLPPSQLV
ncbi:MAG: IS110 family transposase [Anaerolineae bacterium]